MKEEFILSGILILMMFSLSAFSYIIGVKRGFKKHEKIFKGLEKMNQSWMIFYREQAGFRLMLLLKQNLSEEDLKLLRETESKFLDEHEKRFKEAENL